MIQPPCPLPLVEAGDYRNYMGLRGNRTLPQLQGATAGDYRCRLAHDAESARTRHLYRAEREFSLTVHGQG